MVARMTRRAVFVAPVVVAALWAFGGMRWGVSGLAGVALTVLNLWLAGRLIGGVAENNPQLLLPAAMAAFVVGLAILVGAAFALRATDAVYFPVTGLVLIGTHLLLVLWEASGAYGRVDEAAVGFSGESRVRS